MVKTVDYTQRKNRVLAAAVSAFINECQPVSSQDLSDSFELSPATLRSILSELEEEGYLAQPHTSSGRVPTDLGYRYYVDFLMAGRALSEEQKSRVTNSYRAALSSLDRVLERTTDIIAELTHYAAIVSIAEQEDRLYYNGLSNIVAQPEFRNIEKLSLLVRFLEEKKQVLELLNRQLSQPFKVYIGTEIACPDINDVCSLVVSPYRGGKKHAGKIAVLGPRRMSYDQTVSALEFISGTLDSVLEEF